MSESKPIETITLTFAEYNQAKEEKKVLPKFFVVDAMGLYVFIKTRDRTTAQEWVNENYGAGKYRVRTYVQDGAASSDASCRATETRRGQHVRNESFGIFRGLK